jgi:hypothetical protein
MNREKKFPSLRRVVRDVWDVWDVLGAKDGEKVDGGWGWEWERRSWIVFRLYWRRGGEVGLA